MLKNISFVLGGLVFTLGLFLSISTVKAGEKVTICHLTQSQTNKYVWITISVNALDAHLAKGDFIPTETTQGCTTGGDPLPE